MFRNAAKETVRAEMQVFASAFPYLWLGPVYSKVFLSKKAPFTKIIDSSNLIFCA